MLYIISNYTNKSEYLIFFHYVTKVLRDLGGEGSGSDWNFSNAETILLYCNGAWCGQSPTAINALIELGYPKSKMKYYRGGMQSWQLLGLTTIVPKETK